MCPWRDGKCVTLKQICIHAIVPYDSSFTFHIKSFNFIYMFKFMHICTLPDVTRSHQCLSLQFSSRKSTEQISIFSIFENSFWFYILIFTRIKQVSSLPICVIQNSNRLWHESFMARKYLWKNRLKNKWIFSSINLGNILASIKISQLDRTPVKLFICFSFSSKNKNLVCVEVLQVWCCLCYFSK